ncbi:hypothetical protein GEV33_000148 [Tenebrio molitor]|uniref:Uncharacterized protein n=1 Tax=Tenebrio molitor TaxID=7067 RepID=A0A8J6HZ20_TENMO|nr:hypothetical protein GEV33_000148 [Tenebrio molitor]
MKRYTLPASKGRHQAPAGPSGHQPGTQQPLKPTKAQDQDQDKDQDPEHDRTRTKTQTRTRNKNPELYNMQSNYILPSSSLIYDQKVASDCTGLSGGFRGIGCGFKK